MSVPPEAITAAWSTLLDVPGWPPYMARANDYPDAAALKAADEEADAQNEAVIRRLLEAAAPLIAAAERDRIAVTIAELRTRAQRLAKLTGDGAMSIGYHAQDEVLAAVANLLGEP